MKNDDGNPLASIQCLTQKQLIKGEMGNPGIPADMQKQHYSNAPRDQMYATEKPQRNSNLNLICEISESLCEENDTD